jgi:hypothetical protein
MAVARRVAVSLDCADAMPLAEFWAAMLGGEVLFATPTGVVVVQADGILVVAMEISDYTPPTWPDAGVPKQIHLDLVVADLDAAVAESELLGATAAAVQPDPRRWRVLLDPAGHPFCLTTVTPPED